MSELMPFVLHYYEKKIAVMLSEKHGFSLFEALRKFLDSKTYQMLADERLAMWEFSPIGILDMWEAEQASDDPRNSLYLTRD